MIKGGIAILVLGFGVLLLVYYFGGYSSFDPTAKGREAKAAISPGMKWTQVVDAAGEPGRYQLINRFVEKDSFGQEVEVFRPGLERRFDYGMLEGDIANGQAPYGFTLSYVFSAQVTFRVWFDGNGVAESIEDAVTMADLLQTRDD
jgi:hypothetical protein